MTRRAAQIADKLRVVIMTADAGLDMFARAFVVAFTIAVAAPSLAQEMPPAPQPTMSLAEATSAALKQVSAYEQARIDEAIAAQDVHQAAAAMLPRARDSFTITYNSQKLGQPSFIG